MDSLINDFLFMPKKMIDQKNRLIDLHNGLFDEIIKISDPSKIQSFVDKYGFRKIKKIKKINYDMFLLNNGTIKNNEFNNNILYLIAMYLFFYRLSEYNRVARLFINIEKPNIEARVAEKNKYIEILNELIRMFNTTARGQRLIDAADAAAADAATAAAAHADATAATAALTARATALSKKPGAAAARTAANVARVSSSAAHEKLKRAARKETRATREAAPAILVKAKIDLANNSIKILESKIELLKQVLKTNDYHLIQAKVEEEKEARYATKQAVHKAEEAVAGLK
jgi:hypothetical protein